MDNQLSILNYLGKHQNESYTMHKLSNILKIPYATFHRTIKGMTNLITTQIIGKAKTLTLNKNPIIKSYLTISSEEEKAEYLKKQPVINKITTELNTEEIIILFGSYAKRNIRKESDIDILIINQKGNKSISFSKYETVYKIKINPIFITKKEFTQMLTAKDENLGKQALKDHILLNNPEEFWRLVLNG